jgi:type II secretion system protein J
MRIGRTTSRSGFTLLEMLVALALMAILASTLYGSLHVAFMSRRRAEASVAPVRRASTALDLLYGDMAAALPPTGVLAGEFIGTDEVSDRTGDDADAVLFYAVIEDAGRINPGISMIEFVLEEDDDGEDYVLIRRVTDNLLAPTTQDPVEETLCRNVLALNVRYFDGSDWLDAWDSTTVDNTLPLAVEVTIAVRDDADVADDVGYELTRVILMQCAGAPEEGAIGTGSSRQES